MAQATPFQKEAWSEYALGVCIILVRIFARIKVVGFKNWQGDDYFAILALVFWTVSCFLFPARRWTLKKKEAVQELT